MSVIRLIVGLGNPGSQYEKTRHNAGFWFVEEVARQYGVQFRPETKFFGQVARVQQGGLDFWLLKPTTFMNRSGQSIQAIANFYKIPVDQILLIHDELDLPVQTIRLKKGGGHGGHNGLRDAIAALGSKDFYRLRIGIDHPGDRRKVVDYVLNPPSKLEMQLLETAIYEATRFIPQIVKGAFDEVMQQLHTAQT